MRLLWLSNFSSDSAYAIQAHLLIPRLQQLGHEISVLELTQGRSKPHTVAGVSILPIAKDPLASDSVLEHFKRGGYHAVVSLVDPWGMQPQVMQHLPWFPFSPVDTQPVSPRNVAALRACQRPIALTHWGANMLHESGFDPFYIPHGFDPQVWQPGDKFAAREALGIPANTFFVAFVGVNDSLPSRKGLAELLYAWHIFRGQHEDVTLYLHTDPQGHILEKGDHAGIDVFTQLKSLGLEGDYSIRMADTFRYRTQSIPASELVQVAQAADALILPTKGEGFGVPIIEFAAAGTPTITTDFGSTKELASQMGGVLVNFEPDWGWQNALTAKPLIAGIVAGLEALYQERGTVEAVQRRNAALQGAQAYNINRVFMQHAIPVFEGIAELTMGLAK